MLQSVERLEAGDAAALMTFASELKDVDDPLPFPPRVLRGLQELIPSDDVTYSELARNRRRSYLQVWTNGREDGVEWGHDTDSDDGRDLFWELRPTHPVCGWRKATENWVEPRKASDFVTLQEFRRTPIYDALYRGELDHWLDFGLPPLHDRTRVFIFVRQGTPDYTERDRLVATLLRPHLEARAERAETAARASVALAAVEGSGIGDARLVVLCGANGVIEFASPAARALLKRYLGIDNGRLPRSLLARSQLHLELDHSRLTVRIARTGGLRLLLLEERDLRAERLTTREREILELVAVGSTNAEVGLELGIANATVAKHLEHAYKKLGVRSRTAAAAMVTSYPPGDAD